MIERKIIIACIVSTDFLQKIKPIWQYKYLESGTAKLIARWCWEHYNTFHQAPFREIETIYYKKLQTGQIAKELAEEIEQDILPGLSNEFIQEEINITYLIQTTTQYFKERKLILHNETIQDLIETGKIEDAEKEALQFTPVLDSIKDLNAFILSTAQMRRKEKPRIDTFISPWLKSGQTTIIYGKAGSGKSLLSILIAYAVGLKEYTEIEIGEWQVKQPTGCLYIDGELGELEMDERIAQFEHLGRQSQEHRLRILSLPEYQLETEDSFYLSVRENQLKILSWLKDHPTYKLVVLDSVTTLFGLTEENDNSEWSNKVNPLLRDLRALGVACILLHHAGKDAKKGLRGATAMEAMAHNIFRLINHGAKQVENGEAWFVLSKDKQRAGKYSFKTFAMHFYQSDDDKETHWEETEVEFD